MLRITGKEWAIPSCSGRNENFGGLSYLSAKFPTHNRIGTIRAAHSTKEKLNLRETKEVWISKLARYSILPKLIMAEDSFLHLARPLGPVSVGTAPTTAPLNVVIQPQVCCDMCVLYDLRGKAHSSEGNLLSSRPLSSPQCRPGASYRYTPRNTI